MKFLPRPLSRDRRLETRGERYKWLALPVVGLGGVLGLAVVAVFVEWRAAAHGPAPLASAYAEAFILVAATFVLAMMATLATCRKCVDGALNP